mmetsp:Transcript_2369/g.3727  ORF Transcript_2369/g.3727 Transcript_2369/m.3727 type:complete len:152 (+) Transcript_2369:99-554(+)|eukprot:CAMPEP_0174963496 /NCGR_PEP_ID=MMETSP0004_2-20121128/5363_1 /TAXON_ID=420556 /ORGANISM="Ochromonas sp., Strain CCMP1393" /LENGTH=151 /DNA_ID=CAMNT_0016212129 /DNA_START=18 /DNA_END=473 /DNA_ORIENTATION=+
MDPTKKELYTAKRSSGVDASNPKLQEMIDLLKSDADPTNFLIFKVVESKVEPHAFGMGGITQFSSCLDDDDVYYGAIRCSVGGMVKFYHVYFVGENVGGMKKGKASMFKPTIFGMIDAQGEITCNGGMDEYSQEFIIANIAKLSGCAEIEA